MRLYALSWTIGNASVYAAILRVIEIVDGSRVSQNLACTQSRGTPYLHAKMVSTKVVGSIWAGMGMASPLPNDSSMLVKTSKCSIAVASQPVNSTADSSGSAFLGGGRRGGGRGGGGDGDGGKGHQCH